MSWARAGLCWALATVLAGLWLVDRRHGEERTAARAPEVAGVPSAAGAALTRPRFIEVRRGDSVIAFERAGESAWRVIAPAGRTIPGGLLDAFADQLAAVGSGERIDGAAADESFGLSRPALTVTVVGDDGRRAEVAVGDRTPTGTAAYARLEPAGPVQLVGLNLLYYADLLFDAAR